jgi:heptosyltransferase-2
LDFNPSSIERLCVRSTDSLGDAVMSLAAIRAIRNAMRQGTSLLLVARPELADLFARENTVDRVIRYPAPRNFAARRAFAAQLREERFDCALLLQNSFDAALIAWMAAIPERIGYKGGGRGWFLTRPIPVPRRGEIPRHTCSHYLELARRAGLIDHYRPCEPVLLENVETARRAGSELLDAMGIAEPVIGICPGAARGMRERFAERGRALRPADGTVLVFGAGTELELELAESVAREIPGARNLAGLTLRDFIDLLACCGVILCNDSSSVRQLASALGVPTAPPPLR